MVKLWDVKKPKSPIKTFSGHKAHVYWARFNESNTILATAAADKTIVIWDLKKGDALKRLTVGGDIAYCAEFSKNGNYLAASDSSGTVYVYDTKTWNLVCKND